LKQNKHITLIGINFYPEDTAVGLYSTQLAEYLSQNGFEVSVITGFPYYPQWKINQDYQSKAKFYSENLKNIPIFRYKQYVPENPNFIKRIIHLLDFTFGSYFNLKKIKKTDLVFSVVPFTTDIWLGKKLAKKHKAKLWVHIQDFEFDAAIESKLSSGNSFIFNLLFKIESRLLNKANIVSSISHAMIAKLKTKVDVSKPTYLLPNWVDPDAINPQKAKKHSYLKDNGTFKILYSGNIGQKQDWNLFVQVVDTLKNNSKIEFVIVGAGAYKETLVKHLQDYKNVSIYDPVPFEQLSDLLCSADLHCLFQKKEVVDTVMPSKILGMMASEKPSIIAGNKQSEVAKVIDDSKGGFYFENDQLDDITNQIIELQQNKELAEATGKNARKYIIRNFSSQKILSEFKNQLEKILAE